MNKRQRKKQQKKLAEIIISKSKILDIKNHKWVIPFTPEEYAQYKARFS